MNCEDSRFGNGAARSDAPTGNFLPGSCKPGPKLPYITVDQVDERGAGGTRVRAVREARRVSSRGE